MLAKLCPKLRKPLAFLLLVIKIIKQKNLQLYVHILIKFWIFECFIQNKKNTLFSQTIDGALS